MTDILSNAEHSYHLSADSYRLQSWATAFKMISTVCNTIMNFY